MREPKSLVLPLHHRVEPRLVSSEAERKLQRSRCIPPGARVRWCEIRVEWSDGPASHTLPRLPFAADDGEGELFEFDGQVDAHLADIIR